MEPKIFKKELEGRQATEEEQEEIDRRIEADEPLFEEERADWKPESKKDDGGEKETEEEKAKREAEETAAEEEENQRLLDTADEDLNDDEIEKKNEVLKKKEDEEESFEDASIDRKREMLQEKETALETLDDEAEKSALETEITEMRTAVEAGETETKNDEEKKVIEGYATEYELSFDEAKEVYQKDKNVIEKYGNDPLKMAKAYRGSQAEYSKKAEESDSFQRKAAALEFEIQMSTNFEPEKVFSQNLGREVTREEVIKKYRETYAGLTGDMEDDAVYDLVKRDTLQKLRAGQETSRLAVERDSTTAREELMKGVPEEVQEHKAVIRKMLDDIPNRRVLEKSFNLNDIVYWVKGKYLVKTKDDIEKSRKEAEEKGYKRGLEQKKIVGIKQPSSGSSKTKKNVSPGVKTFDLSDEQRKEALDFYAEDPISEERKYELFAEAVKED